MSRVTAMLLSLVLVGPVQGCTGTLKLSSPERDAAVAFYGGLYPVSMDLRRMTDEWNKWNSQASPQEYRTNLLSKSQQYESNLRTLANKAGALSAPSGLSDLKDLTASAINKYIESFAAAQDYARSPTNDSVRRKAEVAQLEGNKLLGLAADKWDEGLARYGIKPSEIGQ